MNRAPLVGTEELLMADVELLFEICREGGKKRFHLATLPSFHYWSLGSSGEKKTTTRKFLSLRVAVTEHPARWRRANAKDVGGGGGQR